MIASPATAPKFDVGRIESKYIRKYKPIQLLASSNKFKTPRYSSRESGSIHEEASQRDPSSVEDTSFLLDQKPRSRYQTSMSTLAVDVVCNRKPAETKTVVDIDWWGSISRLVHEIDWLRSLPVDTGGRFRHKVVDIDACRSSQESRDRLRKPSIYQFGRYRPLLSISMSFLQWVSGFVGKEKAEESRMERKQ